MQWSTWQHCCSIFLLLIQFQAICSLPFSPPLNLTQLCRPDQSQALLDFKNIFSINSSSSTECDRKGVVSYPKMDTWKEGGDCCSWDGVTCDRFTGKVIGLDLSCGWLQGTIPSNSSLLVLSHIQKLNLAYNGFLQGSIPQDFAKLVGLRHINLSSSRFSGLIPSPISNLYNLVSLDMSDNYDLRLDTPSFSMLTQNLTQLQVLFLDTVDLSSVAPSSLHNLSSSVLSLSLSETNLQGSFPDVIFQFPYLEKLQLSYNEDLMGTIPVSNLSRSLRVLDLLLTSFWGELPISIGNLNSLKVLSLSSCNFWGSIPASLGNLTQLTYLDLSFNGITGQIPTSLSKLWQLSWLGLTVDHLEVQIPHQVFGNLSKLTDLYLEVNNSTSQLPVSIFNLPEVSSLELTGNQLVGSLPYNVSGLSKMTYLALYNTKMNGRLPPWLYTIPSLTSLSLSNNHFNGPIPHQFQSEMDLLDLGGNEITGQVPESVFHLENLIYLDLSSNNLTGTVELERFSKLKKLRALSLSDNSLSVIVTSTDNSSWPKLQYFSLASCNLTEFPGFLRTQQDLAYLVLSNNLIVGRIPQWLSQTGNHSLKHLDLSHNLLTSTLREIPWKDLQFLDLSHNMLQGPVPAPPQSMVFFSISNNRFSGKVSSMICNAGVIQILDLSHNNLSGRIPQCLGHLSKSLLALDLGKNRFHGSIPVTFAKHCQLKNLNLNGNQLEGALPFSMVNCKQLEVLDLGKNQIRDTFPYWLDRLPDLKVLVLRSNKFYGFVRASKTNYSSFSKLRVFDLSNNKFVGPIPKGYLHNSKAAMDSTGGGTESGIRYMGEIADNISYATNEPYYFSVALTLKGNDIEMQRVLQIFTTLDLSGNNFEGEIPEYIGKLRSLQGLNLSHNNLSGGIPSSLGNLTALEWLDLSVNKLSGHIPPELAGLTFLSFMNLSQNRLTGPIPQGKQFNTFQNTSYEGNVGLCGFPLSKACEPRQLSPPDIAYLQEDDSSFFRDGFGWKAVLIGYASGILFGVAMGCLMFRLRKPKWLLAMIFGRGLGRTTRRRRIVRIGR
ncbi:hypothetical protein Tsubulata_023551 [Turnera subulata]|uniref:Leucine-rich repeat-containing N-terminal plant-type domain-containing protein n=1 Tax=Turnera subulata TaxID=218843 RepID=A0A9Q0IZI3_9ROSI|nr:hypothetical protein Tsubulata_023551 [Turnera subulata]